MSDVDYEEDFPEEGVVDDLDLVEDIDAPFEVHDSYTDAAEAGDLPEDEDEAEDDMLEAEAEAEAEGDIESSFAVLDDLGDTELMKDYIYNASAKPQEILVAFSDSDAMIITSNTMNLYEYTRVVAIRTKQISLTGRHYTDCVGLIEAEAMAKKEIRDRKCPLCINRHVGYKDGKKYIEVFKVNTMNVPFN